GIAAVMAGGAAVKSTTEMRRLVTSHATAIEPSRLIESPVGVPPIGIVEVTTGGRLVKSTIPSVFVELGKVVTSARVPSGVRATSRAESRFATLDTSATGCALR